MNRGSVLLVVSIAIGLAGLMMACAQPTPRVVEKVVRQTVVVKETVIVERKPVKLVMAFVPSGDTQEIITAGEAIERQLEQLTGYEIDANVATSYAAVVEALCAGNADIGWLHTFSYLLAHEKCGVEVVAATVRRGRSYYTGQIIARADSGIETLQDLKGKIMCWVDPLSTSGYVIPRVMLQAAGIDPDADFARTVIAGSHNNVAVAVYNGDCDAGATYVDARDRVVDQFPDIKEKTKVIAESPPIPNDTVSLRKGLPPEVREAVKKALLKMATTEEGRQALYNVYRIEGLQEVDDTFYDAFRATLDAAGVSIEELAGQ